MMPARVAMALQADGWWLRSEIIWHKPNPMPESCTDRPTSAHEKMYLLSKSARYFYDDVAVRTPLKYDPQYNKEYTGEEGKDYLVEGIQDGRSIKSRIIKKQRQKMKMPDGWDTGSGGHGTVHREGRQKGEYRELEAAGVNLRNVWTIATHSFSEAHFATFPPKLVEPCIKAGTSEHGVCSECGAPWVRVVRKEDSPHDGTTESTYEKGSKGHRLSLYRQAVRERGRGDGPPTTTDGLLEAAIQPAVCLDRRLRHRRPGGPAARLTISEEYAESPNSERCACLRRSTSAYRYEENEPTGQPAGQRVSESRLSRTAHSALGERSFADGSRGIFFEIGQRADSAWSQRLV